MAIVRDAPRWLFSQWFLILIFVPLFGTIIGIATSRQSLESAVFSLSQVRTSIQVSKFSGRDRIQSEFRREPEQIIVNYSSFE
jgi:hypothetical protein